MSVGEDTAAEKKEADRTVDKALKDTFPASDPLAATQPGSGITGTEPPPAGPAQRAAETSEKD